MVKFPKYTFLHSEESPEVKREFWCICLWYSLDNCKAIKSNYIGQLIPTNHNFNGYMGLSKIKTVKTYAYDDLEKLVSVHFADMIIANQFV